MVETNKGVIMKKKLLSVWAVIFFIAGMLGGEEAVKILPLEIPADHAAGASTILVDLAKLQAIANELTSGLVTADIILLKEAGSPMITLGSLKKGKIKWHHKMAGGKSLAVKFTDADYNLLAEIVRTKKPQAGFQLAACDENTQAVSRSFAVAFDDFADLAVRLNYPVNASPGQSLGPDVRVILENTGSVAASNIKLLIILSDDDQIALPSSAAAADSGKDIVLENGSETVPFLEAGQQITVNFSGSLKIPVDTAPGKHYLAVLADPENDITELSEKNNINKGYILINLPEPAAFNVEMPETILRFEPFGFGFRISYLDTVLSDGKDWKLCKMQPNLYQIKHVSWKDFYWEIDTYEKAVWEISTTDFCKKGGKARDLKIKVEVAGGSLITPPSHFSLKLVNTRLHYEPAAKKFVLLAYEKPICHLPFWWVCRLESYLFQIRYVLWQDFFWQVDIFKKKVDKVSGGKFCTPGGDIEKLPMQVTVEK